MGAVIRVLFLTLLYTAPLYAEDETFAYKLCVQKNIPMMCKNIIFRAYLTPQQRDIVRERLDPSYISRVLSYLREDAMGSQALPPYGDNSLILFQYRECLDEEDPDSCQAVIINDLTNSEQRRNVRRKLERLRPRAIPTLIEYLTGEPQVAQANPQPPAPSPRPSPSPQAASPTPPSASSPPAFNKPVRTPMAEVELGFQNFVGWVGTAFEVVFALVALLVVFVLFLNFSRKSEERTAWANLPAEGLMKVNIEEQMTPAGSFNSKQVPCGLKLDIKISQKDWQAIAAAGLMKKVLFRADGPSGKKYDPENFRDWLVEDLKHVTYASFWDTDRMHQAKEELIESLHNLRDHIDSVRDGPKKETMEI
jgi:hypothetical protein